MTAEAALDSQKVSLIAENNNRFMLDTQRKEMELRAQEQRLSNRLLHHLWLKPRKRNENHLRIFS